MKSALLGILLGAAIYPHAAVAIKEVAGKDADKCLHTVEGTEKLGKAIQELAPDTIVIISPHGIAFSDAISIAIEPEMKGSFAMFRCPEIKFSFHNDLDLTKAIIDLSKAEGIPVIEMNKSTAQMYGQRYELDHGVMVPMHFLTQYYKPFKLVSITYAMLSSETLANFGKVIRKAIEESGKRVLLLASGDLSHRLSKTGNYSFSPMGKVFDEKIVDLVKNKDLDGIINFDEEVREEAGECGLNCFKIMAGALKGLKLESEVFSYEGPFGVGYMTAILKNVGANMKSENEKGSIEAERNKTTDPYVALAKASLSYYLEHKKLMPVPPDLPAEMLNTRAGCFVSMKKRGRLRGCIGTIVGYQKSLAMEIISNAVSAGMNDSRFSPVRQEELDEIVFSVDVLKEPEPINSIEELDVKKYGVIVTFRNRRGLLLPNLEGVDTPEEQLSIAMQKAGIYPDDNYKLERFEVIRHE